MNGVTEVALVTYIAETKHERNNLHVRCEGPEGLLRGIPFPFEPPGIAAASEPEGFRHWWRQIHYSFDLPNPVHIPPLASPLAGPEMETVARFIQTSRDLAAARVMSDRGSVSIAIDEKTGAEHIVADFPKRDIQIGFTTLLRQCHGPQDEARFDVVFEFLRRAATALADAEQASRLQQLYAWNAAVIGLRKTSLDQRVRDRYVSEEGWKVWGYQEDAAPAELIRILNYGDLIHWGATRGSVACTTEDKYAAALQRTRFFRAALGLAHITVGFGDVARALTTPRGTILPP